MITRAKISAVRASGVRRLLTFLSQMRRLFEGGSYLNILPDKFTFFHIFIQRYTFYLLIFLWTNTKLIVNLELREKFTQ